MVTFHVLNDILVYRSDQRSYIKGQEDGRQLFILSFIHLSCILFYTLEVWWQIRQKIFSFQWDTQFNILGLHMAVQGMKMWCDYVGVAPLVWVVRDTSKIKSELQEAAIQAKSREKKVPVEERAGAESRGRESIRWVLEQKKVSIRWA